MDERIKDVVRRQLAQRMDDMIMREFMGAATTSTVNEPTTLNVETMLEDCRKILLNMKRDQITFVVDLAHVGPIMAHDTPNEGKRVEMSWHHALELHKHWPIKLHNALSASCAEFVPVSGIFPEFVGKHPTPPPWTVDSESDLADDLESGSKGEPR